MLRFDEVIGDDGIRRCAIVLDPELVRTTTAKKRPFQGWRYLQASDAPADLTRSHRDDDALPAGMSAALDLADQGFDVHLVEREDRLGGNMNNIFYQLGGADPQVKLKETIDAVNTILIDVKAISGQIRGGEGLLHAILYDPAGGELVNNLSVASGSAGDLMKDLSSAVKSVDNIVKKVERGEGSLGGIINDPTVYEDLKVILGGAKRSKTIKGLVHYTIKKKKEEEVEATEQ